MALAGMVNRMIGEAEMADEETTETTETTETVEEDAQSEAGDLDKIKAALKKANAEAAKYRNEAKTNAGAAKRLRAAEDADKSETQRLGEQLAAAEKRAVQAEGEVLRADVASKKGLTVAQSRRLVGGTREDLEADADELLAVFAPAEPGSDDSRSRPKESLRGGASSEEKQDYNKIADEVYKRNHGSI